MSIVTIIEKKPVDSEYVISLILTRTEVIEVGAFLEANTGPQLPTTLKALLAEIRKWDDYQTMMSQP